ncbi:Cytochrome p450, partial [Thalictrum thalictroides]
MITSRNIKLNLPPSPPKLPIIGNLHQIGRLPHRSFHSLARKHDPIMLLYVGQTPTVIVSSVDAAKEVIKIQDLNFCNRPRTSIAERLVYSYKDLAFSPYGKYWKEVRKICVLQLLSGQRVESFKKIREEEANLIIDKIHECCATVNFGEIIYTFTNNVVCRATIGRKFGADEGDKNVLITEFMDLLGVVNIADYIPWLSMMNKFNGLNARVEKNFKGLDCFLDSVIEEHIDPKKKTKDSGEKIEDFVDVLLGMDDSTNRVSLARDNIKALIL